MLLSFLSFGVFGFWQDSLDLLIVTGMAVVITVVVGLPLAVLAGTNPRANKVITVVLDFMQTMPTFVYLVPIVLFFGIGVGGAVVSTLIYAVPPLVRIGGFGIREVSTTTIEATDSAGQTYWQRLLKVQLPMARKTLIVGLNQTILAALSMATIASYINGPGLGKPVLNALVANDFGGSFVPGVLIVVMAVMLDRTTTAASERSEKVARGGGGNVRVRRIALAGTGVAALVAVWLSRRELDLAEFPEYALGQKVSDAADDAMGGIVDLVGGFTEAFKDAISYGFLNPLQSLLAESPWWLAGLAILVLAVVFGGVRALLTTVVCLAGIWYLDLWHDTMLTLTMVLVGTVLVMVLALVFGVWMARNRWVDLGIRPAAGRRTDDPALRLPDPGARALRPVPLHRHRRRRRLRRPSRDQAGGRRRQGCLPDHDRGGSLDRPDHLAGDHQGPAADGQGLARAGHQPGTALRARHGRHRRAGRRPGTRLRRRARHLPQRGVGQGRRRRPDHRAARRDARPDHPCRGRRASRRRPRHPPRLQRAPAHRAAATEPPEFSQTNTADRGEAA